MVESVVHIVGVKVKGRILVNRGQLCDVLGIKTSSFATKLSKKEIPVEAKVSTASGEMWDLEKCLSIKVLPKQSA